MTGQVLEEYATVRTFYKYLEVYFVLDYVYMDPDKFLHGQKLARFSPCVYMGLAELDGLKAKCKFRTCFFQAPNLYT